MALANPQLRSNMASATRTIRTKRDRVVAEMPEWEELRLAGEAIKSSALSDLDTLLVQFEAAVTEAGGQVHWARTAEDARRIVVGLVRDTGQRAVVKVKSMTTVEIGLNEALEEAGVAAYETDLAELIVQLGDDLPSHIVVPAIHRNRHEIQRTFTDHMGEWGRPAPGDLTSEPAALAGAARLHLRDKFLQASVAISGANFLVAETGGVVVVESEGNGRMCLTLPETLITVAGIDKVVPRFEDLDALLQLLPRSATGERMNPYTSVWTGVHPGDGPQRFHVVLLDNGRSAALADPVGRQALRCIRCAACLNVCPVYERVGGHAYGSVYPGPIGAVLAPQLDGVVADDVADSLPYASTLCGACFDACPVRIDIPRLLVHLRGQVVDAHRSAIPRTQEQVVMRAASVALGRPGRLELAARLGAVTARLLPGRPGARRLLAGRRLLLPGWLGGWSAERTVPLPEEPTFSAWWRTRSASDGSDVPAGSAAPDGGASLLRGSRPGRPPRVTVRRRLELRDQARRRRATREAPIAGDDRTQVLAAIGGALRGSAPEAGPAAATGTPTAGIVVPRDYRRSTDPGVDPVVRFMERVADYRATVRRISEEDLAVTLRALLAPTNRPTAAATVGVAADLPVRWTAALRDAGAQVCADTPPLDVVSLDRLDAALTGCAVAIAETGTVVLDGGPGQGRRALTLVPDHHVVVVRADQIVGRVPDAVPLLHARGPQTWISGPSATSDIELDRVEGVHGPRRLDMIVID